ncbi:MAG: response regulator [Magnetococcales bacterium]|nr:response regulator [Magnetococcales bacterium]
MNPVGKTILVVDDMTSIRALARNVLEEMGFHVEEASNGREGLERIETLVRRQHELAMIIADLNMPVMDGLEFIRTVRTFDKSTPILMLTTESEAERRQAGRQAGANGWAVKPISLDNFQNVVKHFTAQ